VAAGGYSPDVFADFSDILGDFFGLGDLLGGGRRRSRAQRGEDIRYDLELGFEEAVFGMSAEIQMPRMELCDRCHGVVGARHLAGRVPHVPWPRGDSVPAELSFDPARVQHVRGIGKVIRNPCGQCRGNGYRQVQRKLKVNIPAGVDDGTRLRLSNEGQPGVNGGPPAISTCS